jgi:hypothetical protein
VNDVVIPGSYVRWGRRAFWLFIALVWGLQTVSYTAGGLTPPWWWVGAAGAAATLRMIESAARA